MIPRTYLSFRKFVSGLLLAPFLSVFGIAAPANGYSQKTVAELINDLAQIDSQSPGVNSAAIYEGFVAEDSPGSFDVGVLGVAPPKVPSQMSELVRRGPVALPELIKHLDDKRPTKLEVGNKPSGRQVGVDAFAFMFFGSNGGLESIAFDIRVGPPWRIVTVDQVAGAESATAIAPSMAAFIEAIGLEAEGQD